MKTKETTEEKAQAPPKDTEAERLSCDRQLTNYIRSGKAGIFLTSYEEVRVMAELQAIVAHLDSIKNRLIRSSPSTPGPSRKGFST